MTSGLTVELQALEKSLSKNPVREIPKNRPLLYQGEIPTMAFYVKSGIVKIYNITGDGEERVVGYESSGGLMPIEWLFGRSQVSLYYYDTFTDCEVIRVPKEELLDYMNINPKVALSYLDRSLAMLMGATIHLHALQQPKARQKLLYIMQYLVLRFGLPSKQNKQMIDLRLTHQEIANIIGITRETVSTEISKLIKEKVLAIDDYRYVVDMDRAVRLLGEDDFNNLSL
jgi:CRP/FNR family transcriptional regulator, cyclic AMP receptor protein